MFQTVQARRATAVIDFTAHARTPVSRNVWFLGLTSFLTDLSSEMIVSSLPAYLVVQLGLTPLAFGAIDGIYQGITALTRLAGGFVADRVRRYKEVAVVGYALSAVCKGLLLVVSAAPAVASVIAVERVGKGVRTAPRDAIIASSASRSSVATAFGVHRALDTAGAALGPFVAFGVLTIAPRAFDAVFVVSLAFAVMGLTALLLFVKNPITGDRAATRSTILIRDAFGLVLSADFARLAVSAAVLSLATVSDGFLYLAMQHRLLLDARFVPLMFAGTALCYFLFAVPMGRMADRLGWHTVYLGGYGILLSVYVMVLAPVPAAIQMGAVLLLMGAYYGATDGVLAALTSHMLPGSLRSTGLAAVATATSLARLVSSVAFGYLWTIWGDLSAIRIFAGLLLVSLVVATFTIGRTTDGSRR